MIQENEIRVGNYYHHNDNWSSLNHKGIFKWTRDDWYCLGECTIDLENVSAIPLTEEILLKCGFEKEGFWLIKGLVKIEIPLSRGYFKYAGFVKINYLHQLQNLYFSLTGEELEIEL